MMDLISRQKAIDALMDALNDVGVLDAEDINTVFQMLPPEQPEPQWISCKDKLPPNEKKTYWVCLGNGSQCECRWTNDIYGFGEIDDRWGWSYLDKPRYSTIVAWRELPEPYKESEVAT